MSNNVEMFDLIVVGGGAAGFFAAIQAAQMKPGLKILILEKSSKVLAKVKVSGGGRCNVTHHCYNPFELARHYPRGEKKLKEVFKAFNAKDMVEWLTANGVEVKIEKDGRMFPTSDNAQTVIDCFLNLIKEHDIQIEMESGVEAVVQHAAHFEIHCVKDKSFCATNVLIAIGGNPNQKFYDWIQRLGHTVQLPIPSLFTFNDSEKKFTDLMGVSVTAAEVKIAGTKFVQKGPVLITHWGLSGPAVIKLSAWAAEILHEKNYSFTVLVSWVGAITEVDFKAQLSEEKETRAKQRVFGNPIGLPIRLWERLCELSEIESYKVWGELSQRSLNKLMESLLRCPFQIKGKTTFKEEFVTCGGVALNEIELSTMESKKVKRLYFAGEVLDVDGETGGFNFQAAWSTAYVAAKAITK